MIELQLSKNRLEYLVEKLRQEGHRITPQRVAILKAVLEDNTHPTAAQVYEKVRQEYPMLSLATVYKTLDLMKAFQAATEVNTGGTRRIDGYRAEPHQHLICIQCHNIIDLDPPRGVNFTQVVSEYIGVQVIENRAEYYWLCPDCKSQPSQVSQPGLPAI